jgi:2-phospho-L-lactate transferase/gluconeogenesis factor (CofD/UPF0052 family)
MTWVLAPNWLLPSLKGQNSIKISLIFLEFKMLNVVIINGGRGASETIPALISRQGLYVTSVVNAYDDGKSTGQIRRFFGMLGPSDIRKVQELMLPSDDPDYISNLNIFRYRYPSPMCHAKAISTLNAFAKGESEELVGSTFKSTKIKSTLQIFLSEFLDGLNIIESVRGEQFDFSDCSIMNCLYAGAFLSFNRNIEDATIFIDRLFKLRGTVLPTSIEDKQLVALREDGQMLYSEAEIVELRSNVRIERIYLLDKPLVRDTFDRLSLEEKRYFLKRHHCYVEVSPGVRRALQQADIIIYSAGTQHSSLYPTYLSVGFASSIADNKSALKVFVTNIGADYETPSYKASDYIKGAFRYLNLSGERDYSMQQLIDVVLINKSFIKPDESYVVVDEEVFIDIPVRRVIDVFEAQHAPGKHDGLKVIQTIIDLYETSSFLK